MSDSVVSFCGRPPPYQPLESIHARSEVSNTRKPDKTDKYARYGNAPPARVPTSASAALDALSRKPRNPTLKPTSESDTAGVSVLNICQLSVLSGAGYCREAVRAQVDHVARPSLQCLADRQG